MAFNINVVNYNEHRTIRSSKISLFDLLKEEDLLKYYAVKVNNRLRELTYEIHYDATIEFIDLNDSDACNVYERSLRYLFCMATYELYPELKFRLSYSVSRSIYVSPLDDFIFDSEKLNNIKIDGFFKNTLAILNLCFCPPDNLTPLSPISVKKPSGKSII